MKGQLLGADPTVTSHHGSQQKWIWNEEVPGLSEELFPPHGIWGTKDPGWDGSGAVSSTAHHKKVPG